MLLIQEYAVTSDDALVLDELPDAPILIVGAGYISVEFAGIFNSFGAKVHLVLRKDLPLTGWVFIDTNCSGYSCGDPLQDFPKRGGHVSAYLMLSAQAS